MFFYTVGAVVYAQHSIDIFSSKIFCDKSTLKPIMGNTKDKSNYCEILEKYMYSKQNKNSGEYFFLPDGCVLSAPEKRQRMVFYGKDANNNVLALYIPTLG